MNHLMSLRLRRALYRYGVEVATWTIGLGVVAAVVLFGIVFPSIAWKRGIYAGFHYQGAKSYVQEVTAYSYGLAFSKTLRFAVPSVVNTHSQARGLYAADRQVREFHLIGPRGVRWCVSVWNGGHDWTRDYKIVKGCSF